MLKQIAEDVWVHDSEFLHSKTTVVKGATGVLLIDPGITSDEMADIAADLQKLGQPVTAGFATHPHWDHTLWHPKFGDAPRYGTARCAADMKEFLSHTDWKEQVAPMLPPDIGDKIPLDLMGHITGLPAGTAYIPWDGPKVKIIEHQAHAHGHAALLIEQTGVLITGDMLSDTLIPFLDLEATDPVGDYLAALQLLEDVAGSVTSIITGHGSVGDAKQLHERIKLDRAYIQALHDGGDSNDPRLTTGPNRDWLPGVHKWQQQQVAGKKA